MGSLNDRVWFTYAEGIQAWAGKNGGSAKSDPNAVYFIASTVNKGPAVGSFVPESYMNSKLHQLCDGSIRNGNPVYGLGFRGGYFEDLFEYLVAVKLKEIRDPELDQKLREAKQSLIMAHKYYGIQCTDALDGWSTDQYSGSASGTGFETWASMKSPGLMMAQRERSDAAVKLMQHIARVSESYETVLTKQLSACLAASDRLRPASDLNMMCSLDQTTPSNYQEYYRALQNGSVDSLSPLSESPPFYMPAYNIDPAFETSIDEWARVPIDAEDEFSWNINSSELKQSSWEKLGHEEGSEGIHFGFIRTEGVMGEPWSDFKVTTEPGSFELQLTAQRAGLFNVTQVNGMNVKQFQVTYPKTDYTVYDAKDTIQPTQLFCASRVRLRVKFTGSVETGFDNAVNEVKRGKGWISILGFTVGDVAGRTENEITHTSNFVKDDDGWYELKPTLVAGGCSVLAVTGSKLH